MARSKKQTPQEPAEIPIEKPKRSRKKVVEELKEQIGLKTGDEIPRQLTPAEPVLEPLPRAEQPPIHEEQVKSTPETARPRPGPLNGKEPPEGFAAKVVASRMQAVPHGFFNVASFPSAGIRVNKSADKKVAAIQFAEDRLPERTEKDALEALGQPESEKFSYRGETRQWHREASDTYGANIIDAVRLAESLAESRKGRGR